MVVEVYLQVCEVLYALRALAWCCACPACLRLPMRTQRMRTLTRLDQPAQVIPCVSLLAIVRPPLLSPLSSTLLIILCSCFTLSLLFIHKTEYSQWRMDVIFHPSPYSLPTTPQHHSYQPAAVRNNTHKLALIYIYMQQHECGNVG